MKDFDSESIDDEDASEAQPASSLPPEEPTFSFPPPSVPPPPGRQLNSVAPVALDPSGDQPASQARRTGVVALVATALTGIFVAIVFGSYSLLSSSAGPSWGWGLARPSPAAAPPAVLEQTAEPSPAAPDPAVAPRVATVPIGRVPDAKVSALSSGLDATLWSAAARCREDGMVPVSVSVVATFSPQGAVQDAHADAPERAAGVAGCLVLAARSMKIAPFDGDAITVTRVITIR
jgi:hypothetical protein